MSVFTSWIFGGTTNAPGTGSGSSTGHVTSSSVAGYSADVAQSVLDKKSITLGSFIGNLYLAAIIRGRKLVDIEIAEPAMYTFVLKSYYHSIEEFLRILSEAGMERFGSDYLLKHLNHLFSESTDKEYALLYTMHILFEQLECISLDIFTLSFLHETEKVDMDPEQKMALTNSVVNLVSSRGDERILFIYDQTSSDSESTKLIDPNKKAVFAHIRMLRMKNDFYNLEVDNKLKIFGDRLEVYNQNISIIEMQLLEARRVRDEIAQKIDELEGGKLKKAHELCNQIEMLENNLANHQ